MGSVCMEHNHHIPPRKLLTQRGSLSAEYLSAQSPSKLLQAEAALTHKLLPYNGDSGSDRYDPDTDSDSDPYSSDPFRMYEFKIRKCTRSRSHDWTDCPFSHPGEKARRRDLRKYHYSGTVCPEYRRAGSCSKGDECEFAHGVFECWLHPARYRTEACKDGKNCKRKVCFFAHSPRELRVLPPLEDGDEREGSKGERGCHGSQHCCRHCCAVSPTSTLMGMPHFSPPMSPSGLSPPRSPMKAFGLSGFSQMSRYSDPHSASRSTVAKGLNYEDMVIAELLGSLEGMNISDTGAGLKTGGPNKAPRLWVDVGYDNTVADNDHQHQFNVSRSTPINSPALPTRNYNNFNDYSTDSASYYANVADDSKAINDGGLPGPDLGWVNELLM